MTTDDGVRTLIAWLATYGVHSTLFLGVAWGLCALRPLGSRTRERVWKLALVGGIASATLQLASGARPVLGCIDWRPAGSTPEAAHVAPLEPQESETGEPRSPNPEREPLGHLAASWSPDPAGESIAEDATRGGPRMREEQECSAAPRARRASEPEHSVPSVAVRPPPAGAGESPDHPLLAPLATLSRSDSWPGFVLGGWIASGLLGLAGLLFSWTCLRRRMLGRCLLVDGPLVEMLDQLRAQAGVRRRVRLSLSPRISAPFSTGLFRPEVCLPAAVPATLSRAQQEALLAHELAHIVRRDPAWFGLGFVIEKVFFFQPLNRLARRRLSELAEDACDDWAVRWTGARLALASCLTEVAGWVVGERPSLVAPPGLAGNRSRLGKRVARLLDDRRSPACEPRARWWPPIAAGALAVATLAVPGVSAGVAEPAATGAHRSPDELPELPGSTAPSFGAPAPAPAQATEPSARDVLSVERGVLESELALLESELRALHAELEHRALSTRFADALLRIEERMQQLRVQQARARVLLARLASPNTPASEPAPPAEALPPTANPGDSR